MITKDRLELNERFVHVFKLLEERGVIVKNDRNGRGMGDFAEKLLGNRSYGHVIRAYLNPKDKRVISYSQARTLCREFGISEDYMLYGIGSPFDQPAPKTAAPSAEAPSQGNILFTTTEAFAGASLGAGMTSPEGHTWFSIPGISGQGLVAFPIQGNSMEPLILDGDIVICQPVDSLERLHDNQIYAVKHDGNLWVKYVQCIRKNGKPTRLKLISANHLEHDPFFIELSPETRLYKVIRRISSL